MSCWKSGTTAKSHAPLAAGFAIKGEKAPLCSAFSPVIEHGPHVTFASPVHIESSHRAAPPGVQPAKDS